MQRALKPRGKGFATMTDFPLDGAYANAQFTGECDTEEPETLESLQAAEQASWAELKRAEAICRMRNEEYSEAARRLFDRIAEEG